MRNSFCAAVLGVTLLAAAVMRGEGPSPVAKSVGDKVMCLCGCVAIVNQCPHQGCSTHEEVQAAIGKLAEEGKSEPEILQALAARYGTKILAAPPAKGFNIAAWALPGLGLVFGLVVVVMVVRRMRGPATATANLVPAELDPKMLAALEEEMKTTGMGVRK